MELHGRRTIKTDSEEITAENVIAIINKAISEHNKNREEIDYLYNYYRGIQPILDRVKEVRPEICNKIVENRAAEIVDFKTGYLMGEPLQYVSRGDSTNPDAINLLNEFVFAEEKMSKDKELSDWFHICGTGYRMILPDPTNEEPDDSPFELYTLDPRNTFIVYHTSLGNKPILGVTYYKDEKGRYHYSCYSRDKYFEILDSKVVRSEEHALGEIPIIEYPLNIPRIGAFELVIPLLDAINLTDSNRLDGVEQFIQCLLLFHNVSIDEEMYKKLKDDGAIAYSDISDGMKGEIQYLTSQLNQTETQTLVEHMYDTILTIVGMPNRNGGSSTSDTGTAVIMRDGWSSAESRAKDTELMFKRSERQFLKIALKICNAISNIDLKLSQVEIRFTRRNFENIQVKAQVLDLLLKNPAIHPKLAFEHSGLFTDADLAYSMSKDYAEQNTQEIQVEPSVGQMQEESTI